MPRSETALGALLIARSAYIDNYEIPDWQAVIETHTTEGTPERAAWLAHLTAVVDALEDGKDIPAPPAGSTSGGKRKKKKSAAAMPTVPSQKDQRHAQIRAQRKLDLEGAPDAGEVGPARVKQELANLFPTLYEDSVKANAERGNGTAQPPKLRTKQKQGIVPGNLLPEMEVDQPNTDAGSSTADSSIKEYFTPKKLTGHVFKGVSVTAVALFDVVEKRIFASFKVKSYSAVVGDGGPNELGIVSAISNFFGQSNIGTAQLAIERERQGITTGMKSASDTRFGTTFIQTRAVRRCVPALVTCVVTGTITFATAATKRLIPYLKSGPTHYAFLAQLDSMVKLFEGGANGITTLEGQNTTCADVFYVWVTIAWHLNKLLGDLTSGLSNYRDQHGGLKLVMPALKEGEKFDPLKYPDLFKMLRASARAILKGEQTRTERPSRADADRLTDQLVRWAVGLPPFHQRVYSTSDDSALNYWKGLRRDSNADVLAVRYNRHHHIARVDQCRSEEFNDPRTPHCNRTTLAVRVITPIVRTANVKVSAVGSSSTILSTPSLLDLLNDDNVAPQDVDREALEQALFNQPDPYDLAETDRMDNTISHKCRRCTQCYPLFHAWAVEDYIRLDSVSLEKIISAGKKKDAAPTEGAVPSQVAEATAEPGNEDWDIED
ncbi:hypothetical protein B0H14DRAFT_2569361 [Mycena olivaceomarginata]|nr:hypothetical protein B0H14DRAFT_2569361 [Mycena olivaceomarginata]